MRQDVVDLGHARFSAQHLHRIDTGTAVGAAAILLFPELELHDVEGPRRRDAEIVPQLRDDSFVASTVLLLLSLYHTSVFDGAAYVTRQLDMKFLDRSPAVDGDADQHLAVGVAGDDAAVLGQRLDVRPGSQLAGAALLALGPVLREQGRRGQWRGIGVGIGTSFVISSAVAYLYFRFGRWREKELFEEPVEQPRSEAPTPPAR